MRSALTAFCVCCLVGLAVLAGCQKTRRTAYKPVTPDEVKGDAPDSADLKLRDRIDHAVNFTLRHRRLSAQDHAGWQVVHGILAYGREFPLMVDGKEVLALDYLLGGGELKGWILTKNKHGVATLVEPGSKTGQGHEDQWLGYMAQIGLPHDEPLQVGTQKCTIADLITHAQWHLHDGIEATWTLMALSTYLPLDATWEAENGDVWNIERIVGMEAAQPLSTSACGGTHRLYGLCVAVNRQLSEGGKLTGSWEKADEVIKNASAKAQEYQQPDGSFSTYFFERPATTPDLEKRLHATGHTLEFLTLALTEKQINEPWMAKAASHLVDLLERTEDLSLECGALYHAIHGLELYRNRRWGDPKQQLSASVEK